jgi:antitoxin (DNA-binding transcriptional repressor) of toxin-antitoxin stability system
MTTVNTHEAKTQLSRLLERVEAGEEVIIARAGKPVAVLSRYVAQRVPIAPPGGMAGEGWMADDFDAPVDEVFDALREEELPHSVPRDAAGPRPRRRGRR